MLLLRHLYSLLNFATLLPSLPRLAPLVGSVACPRSRSASARTLKRRKQRSRWRAPVRAGEGSIAQAGEGNSRWCAAFAQLCEEQHRTIAQLLSYGCIHNAWTVGGFSNTARSATAEGAFRGASADVELRGSCFAMDGNVDISAQNDGIFLHFLLSLLTMNKSRQCHHWRRLLLHKMMGTWMCLHFPTSLLTMNKSR